MRCLRLTMLICVFRVSQFAMKSKVIIHFKTTPFCFVAFDRVFLDLMFLLIILIIIIISRAVQQLALSGNIQTVSLEFPFLPLRFMVLSTTNKEVRNRKFVVGLLVLFFFVSAILKFDNIHLTDKRFQIILLDCPLTLWPYLDYELECMLNGALHWRVNLNEPTFIDYH